MKRYFQYLKEYKWSCIFGALSKWIEAVLELLVPLVVANIIDVGIGERGSISYVLAGGGVMLAMGMITVFEHYGALRAARKLLTPLLQFLIGVPGTATLALIACLQSTDGGAALTRQLKDSGALTYREINNFSAFQMVACAPITNFVTFSAAVLAFTGADGSGGVPLSMGAGLAVLLSAKVIGANIMRLIQWKMALREESPKVLPQTSAVAVTIERN